MSVRLAAVTVLLAIERGTTTLSSEIDRARRDLGDERDRALLVELATGTLRWQAELDALFAPCSTRPLASLTPEVRAVVRLAVYQLEHLDRIPAHAVLNEAVELTRTLGQPRAAGFVNAVLRSLGRTRTTRSLPRRPDAQADDDARLAYLSTTLSHPRWLVARWLERHGFDATERWCQFNNTTPDLTIRSCGRIDPRDLLAALRAADIDATPAPFVADALQLPPGSLGRVPASLADELFVQDEASQIVAHLVGASPGDRVLDLCASPGAKTGVLAARLQRQGLLVASDYRAARVKLLARTLRHTGTDARMTRLDATRPLPFGPVFDRVLVDAPCSGLGVLRRDPDLKWSRTLEDLPRLALVQETILSHAAEAVRPGGTLVYATCSSEPEENDAVVHRFLARDSRFACVPVSPGPMVPEGMTLLDAHGFLRTLPFRDGLDAFFAAVLVRRLGAQDTFAR